MVNHAVKPQTIMVGVFLNIDLAPITLKVPDRSVTAYQAAEMWKNFSNIEAIGSDAIHIANNGGAVLKSVRVIDMQERVV